MENNKELTPMQELHWFVSDGLDNYDESIKVSQIWAKIKELLPKEKQVIEDAFNEDLYRNNNGMKYVDGKDYYNTKYNNQIK